MLLTLSDIKEKDRVFLLDDPLASSGLFGNAVDTVVDTNLAHMKELGLRLNTKIIVLSLAQRPTYLGVM